MRRERIERGKWAAAGMSYEKGKSLKREMAKISQHITSTAAGVTTSVNQHTTAELSALKKLLLPHDQESTAQTKKRLHLQLRAVQCLEEQEKEEKQAAKKQKQGSSSSSRMAS